MATPAGALVPVPMEPSDEGLASVTPRLSGWRLSERNANYAFGASVHYWVSRHNAFSATLGAFNPGCDGCATVLMAGIENSVLYSLRSPPYSNVSGVIELRSSVGYAREPEVSHFAISLAAPFTLYGELSNATRLGVFVVPGVSAGGSSSNDDIQPLPTIGGGVALVRGRLRVSAGLQRMLIDGSATVFGVSVTTRVVGGRQSSESRSRRRGEPGKSLPDDG